MARVMHGIPSPEMLIPRDERRVRSGRLGMGIVRLASFFCLGLVLLIVGTILVKGIPAMSWEFLSQPPRDGMKSGGIWPMLRGSLLLMTGTLVLVLPLGILGGVCLAEYTGQGRASAFLRSCVTGLAGTPSVVYGLFGLAVFVILFKLGVSLISGWLTLSLFALPVIVLSTETAIKQVPESLVDGSLALGLSRWQTLWRVVIPNALPGIATGVVLSTGRAAGEAPPILLTAGIYFSTAKLAMNWETLTRPVANLSYHLAEGYRQGGTIPEKTIWGTCLTLLLLVLFINLGAIIVRARLRSRQASQPH